MSFLIRQRPASASNGREFPVSPGGSIVNRAITALSASVAAAICTIGLFSVPASAAPDTPNSAQAIAAGNPPCGTLGDFDQTFDPGPAVKPANVRTGISSRCSIIGHIYVGDRLNYHCYYVDAIDRKWTYLDDFDSGATGWVLGADLEFNAGMHCFD
jgi:hypothetical protein